MSKDEVDGSQIDCVTLLMRAAGTLEGAYGTLSDVQEVISNGLQTSALQASDMERLQKLDRATQEVEAIAGVLRALASSMPKTNNPSYDLQALLADVKLSHVIAALQGVESKKNAHDDSGEFTLF